MSVLLQSMRTDKYVGDAGVWTEKPEQAHPFADMDAVIFCYEHHLGEMRILGRAADSQQNFTSALLEIHTV